MAIDTTRAVARSLLLLDAHLLAPGNHMLTCPLCHGGERLDTSLSLTITAPERNLLWHCKRAKCGWAGVGSPDGSFYKQTDGTEPTDRGKVFTPRPFEGNLGEWDRLDPLYAFDGTLLGHQSRRKPLYGAKVVKTWPLVPRRLYSAYTSPRFGESLWLVEDIRSALALAGTNRDACALLGTHVAPEWIETELVPALRYFGFSRFLVALDPGAESAAVTAKKLLTEYTGVDTLVVPLSNDIKDMSAPEVKALTEYYDGPRQFASSQSPPRRSPGLPS